MTTWLYGTCVTNIVLYIATHSLRTSQMIWTDLTTFLATLKVRKVLRNFTLIGDKLLHIAAIPLYDNLLFRYTLSPWIKSPNGWLCNFDYIINQARMYNYYFDRLMLLLCSWNVVFCQHVSCYYIINSLCLNKLNCLGLFFVQMKTN